MRRSVISKGWAVGVLLLVGLCGCSKEGGGGGTKTTGSRDEAQALLKEFQQPNADHVALTKRVRPKKEDFDAVFESTAAAKAQSVYGPAWDGGQIVIKPTPEQTELKLVSATKEELTNVTGGAEDFPGGYREALPYLKSGVTFYAFRFVKPGDKFGMNGDGLVYVNGHWRMFPQPWRAVR